jgi:Co/Zn/Cd efflux system component
MNIAILFDFVVEWIAVTLSKSIRIILALCVGLGIFWVTHYASDVTHSSTMFAEMFHAGGDIIEIVAYSLALVTTGILGKIIGKTSGLLVIAGGCAPFYKVYLTADSFAHGNTYAVQNVSALFWTSMATIFLLTLQIVLIAKEHEEFSSQHHVHDAHHSLMAHLWSDLAMVSLGLVLAGIMATFPQMPLITRLFDVIFTSCIGYWMIKRGIAIVFRKNNSMPLTTNPHHHSHNEPHIH